VPRHDPQAERAAAERRLAGIDAAIAQNDARIEELDRAIARFLAERSVAPNMPGDRLTELNAQRSDAESMRSNLRNDRRVVAEEIDRLRALVDVPGRIKSLADQLRAARAAVAEAVAERGRVAAAAAEIEREIEKLPAAADRLAARIAGVAAPVPAVDLPTLHAEREAAARTLADLDARIAALKVAARDARAALTHGLLQVEEATWPDAIAGLLPTLARLAALRIEAGVLGPSEAARIEIVVPADLIDRALVALGEQLGPS
jgi:chromosome segregation ATPase